MDIKNWKENISKVIKFGTSKGIIIPYLVANEMGIKEGDYVYSVYDEKTKSLTITKER